MNKILKRYQRAEQLLSCNLKPTLKNNALVPHWINGNTFWYQREQQQGYEFVFVDTQLMQQRLAFDHQCMASVLSQVLSIKADPLHLPIQQIDFSGDDKLRIVIENREQNARSHQSIIFSLVDNSYVTEPAPLAKVDKALNGVLSPDGMHCIVQRNNNLYLRQLQTGADIALTNDGEANYSYGGYTEFITAGLHGGQALPPAVVWSPDGRYIAVQRIDERKVQALAMLQSVPTEGVRPIVHRLKFALPEDQHIASASLLVIDIQQRQVIESDRSPVAAAVSSFIDKCTRVIWDANNGLYFFEFTRDRQTIELIKFDPDTAISQVLLRESGQGNLYPGPDVFVGNLQIRILSETNELIWYSSRSGWGHLYRHDLTSGELKNAITSGEFTVTALHHVDTHNNCLYFSACGREPDRDPYYEHFYRASLDGSELVLLTPEACQHDVVTAPLSMPGSDPSLPSPLGLSPDGRFFVDTMSRVDCPPVSVLRSTVDGGKLMTLSEFDNTQLSQTPYTYPVPFTVKACDEQTDLWGVLYRPSDFDELKTYATVLCLYGTPEVVVTPKRFADLSMPVVVGVYRALAELGFIVVVLDPRGTPWRSKAFHNVGYGHLQNAGGIDDQVFAIKQLAERYSWIDSDRVGITGYSGGGFASARAMMTHPDFFKVAVSSSGNHDQRLYVSSWVEGFQGLYSEAAYDQIATAELAGNLKGKLLLTHGDMDPNVHVAHTLQLADALIKHNKDFDLLLLPNRDHDYFEDPYFIRRLWDYFVEHLLGESPPANYEIASKQANETGNRETEKSHTQCGVEHV